MDMPAHQRNVCPRGASETNLLLVASATVRFTGVATL